MMTSCCVRILNSTTKLFDSKQIMKNHEIQNIQQLFHSSFHGPAWHGPSAQQVLEEISSQDALKSVGDGHNIAELVYHMIAWRNFLINKLKGHQDYDVSDEENFQKFESLSTQEWESLKMKLEKSQSEILELLSKVDDAILVQKVGMRDYNLYNLMHGVIHHDLYHLGQIILIKKHV